MGRVVKRSTKYFALAAVCIAAAVFGCGSSANGGDRALVKNKEETRPIHNVNNTKISEYIVTVRDGSDEAVVHRAFSKYGLTSVRRIRKNVFLVNLKSDPGIDELQREIDNFNQIIRIQQNYKYKINSIGQP